MSEKEQGLEVVGYLVDLPEEPELGHWFDEEGEEGVQICRHQPLVRQADAERVIDGLRYKAELYDEVWERATCMGFMNVTMTLAEVDQLRAALSAVTTERDAFLEARNCLIEENTLLYEQIADLIEERDQLSAEVEMLREDAERFRHIERDCDSGMRGIYGDDWVEVIDSYIAEYATMAAKDGV